MVSKTMRSKKSHAKKAKTMKRKHSKSKKSKSTKRRSTRSKRKTMKGGFVHAIKEAIVPLFLTASVIKKGKKKSKSKSRSSK